MPATKKDKKEKRGRSTAAPEGAAAEADAGTGAGRAKPAANGKPPAAARSRGPRRGDAVEKPVQIKAKAAASRIRDLADLSESLDNRRRLRRLAKLVEHGSREVRGIAFIEGLLGECLDEADLVATPRERWLACEAVAWGLAWLARTRRANGSAGGLLERLVKFARQADDSLKGRDTTPARFVVALARLFRDIEACRCLERGATAALVEEIGRLVSEDGAVAIAGEPAGSAGVVERVERWTAVREVAAATGGPPLWDEATAARWQRASDTALRLLGGQGRILTGAGRLPASFSHRLLAAQMACKGAVGRTAAAVSRPQRTIDLRQAKRLLPRDLHAADSATAIIRTGWDRDALRVLVDYRESVPRLEIATADRLLVDGPWSWKAWLGDRPLEAEGPWTLSGFESDRKATFLEIATPLGGGLRLERHVAVLARDGVVLLADAITAATPPANTPLRIESAVALGAGLEAEKAEETRDVAVYDTGMRLTAFPLALPEWTAAKASGRIEAAHGSIALAHESLGGRLYAPLWLDCDPARSGRPLTWRQLTVADTRQNLPRHQAAGFRVQVGRDQWLLYRALDTPRNRTVLGCNLSCEFLLGRIRPDGTVARTLEIE
ncbi:MAG: hypothetical protein ACKOBP_02655 [Planctomycetia bacterium]